MYIDIKNTNCRKSIYKQLNRTSFTHECASTLSVSDWYERFYAHPMYNPATKSYDNLGDNCYDGIWLTALALNCSINKMKEIGMLMEE